MIISTIDPGTTTLDNFFVAELERRTDYKIGDSFTPEEFLETDAEAINVFIKQGADVCLIFADCCRENEQNAALHAKVRTLLPETYIIWLSEDTNEEYSFLQGDKLACYEIFTRHNAPWEKLIKNLDRVAGTL